jgi:hypothetical protein
LKKTKGIQYILQWRTVHVCSYAQAYTLFWGENFKVKKNIKRKKKLIYIHKYKTERIFLGGKYDSIHLSEMIRLFRNFTIEFCCLSFHSTDPEVYYYTSGTLNGLHGTIGTVNGTVNAFHGTIGTVKGTLNGLHGTIRTENGTLNGLHGTIRTER